MAEIADRLKELKDRTGLSNGRLARMIGVTKTTIANYLSGKTEPEGLQYESLMKILDGQFPVDQVAESPARYPKSSNDKEELLRRIIQLQDERDQLKTELAKTKEQLKELGGTDREKRKAVS